MHSTNRVSEVAQYDTEANQIKNFTHRVTYDTYFFWCEELTLHFKIKNAVQKNCILLKNITSHYEKKS